MRSRGSRHNTLILSRRTEHPDTGRRRVLLGLTDREPCTQRPVVERGIPNATARRPMLRPVLQRTSHTATCGLAFFLEHGSPGLGHRPAAQGRSHAAATALLQHRAPSGASHPLSQQLQGTILQLVSILVVLRSQRATDLSVRQITRHQFQSDLILLFLCELRIPGQRHPLVMTTL